MDIPTCIHTYTYIYISIYALTYENSSICGEMHVKLVHIFRKEKVFYTVLYLGDAVFYLGQAFYEN